MEKQRIDKILSHEGFGSRKDIKKLLRNSEVLLNGKRIFDCSTQIDLQNDKISVNEEFVNIHKNIYLMMNKIQHAVSSNKEGNHQTVFDFLGDEMKTPYLREKLHLIGRLDMDTEGLLIFTTDGNLTHKLTSPKSKIEKKYFVCLEKKYSEEEKKQTEKDFLQGISVDSDDNDPPFKCESAKIEWPDFEFCKMICKNSSYDENLIKCAAILTITEGKYHQVKRMFKAAKNKVVFLKRIAEGSLKLDNSLKPGEYRELSEEEVKLLEIN